MELTRRFATVIAVALLLTSALAQQVDDRARQLLEGLGTTGVPTDVTSLDQTMTMKMYQGGQEIVTTTRMVIDYAGDRAAMVTEVMGMTTTMLHVDGATTMTMNGMALPMPPGMDSVFDGVFDQSEVADVLSDPSAVATYDGPVSYADVLSGQQVTYTGNFGMPGIGMESTTVRYVFDDSGRLLGQVIEAEGTDIVSVFVGEPKVEGLLFYDMEMYQVSGDTATLYAEVTYDEVEVNGPVDETLFE